MLALNSLAAGIALASGLLVATAPARAAQDVVDMIQASETRSCTWIAPVGLTAVWNLADEESTVLSGYSDSATALR